MRSGQEVLIYRIIALSMVGTGLMYPFAPEVSMISVLYSLLGYWGFFGWCVVTMGFGMLLFLRPNPRYVFVLTSPLLVFVLVTMIMAVQGSTLTAMIYYVSLWLFPNYFALHRDDDGRRVRRVMNWLGPPRMYGAILLSMALVLWIRPYGSGLEYTYDFLSFTGDPVMIYRLLFAGCGLGLFAPQLKSPLVIGLLCFPMYLHGGIFVYTIATTTFIWALVPLFFGNSFLWITVSEVQ